MSVRITIIAAVVLAAVFILDTIAAQSSQTISTDVRITARLLENGKVEFGLQQRVGDGWGETILPRVNKFPYATATVDRWLFSSSVQVNVEAPIPEQEPSATTPGGEPAWCDDRPSWSSAAEAILPQVVGNTVEGFYSGSRITLGAGHRDHVLPWSTLCLLVDSSAAARAAYSDTRNVVPTIPSFNLVKSDDLAHEWLPDWRERRAAQYAANACAYAGRYRDTATKYGHVLSAAEAAALTTACPAGQSSAEEVEPPENPTPPARITHSHCQRYRNDGGCDRRFRPARCPTHTHATLTGHRNDHC